MSKIFTFTVLYLFLWSGLAMGYDLHIEKYEKSEKGSRSKISESEWKELVLKDGELNIVQSIGANNPKTGQKIEVSNPLMAAWKAANGRDVIFYFSQGKISVRNPDDETIKKMKEIAKKLGAIVVGDEGEEY